MALSAWRYPILNTSELRSGRIDSEKVNIWLTWSGPIRRSPPYAYLLLFIYSGSKLIFNIFVQNPMHPTSDIVWVTYLRNFFNTNWIILSFGDSISFKFLNISQMILNVFSMQLKERKRRKCLSVVDIESGNIFLLFAWLNKIFSGKFS